MWSWFYPKISPPEKNNKTEERWMDWSFFFCLGDLNFPFTRGTEEAKFYESWFLNERNAGSSVGDVTIVLTTIRLNLGNTFISFWRCQFGLPDRIRDFIRTVRWCLNWSALPCNTEVCAEHRGFNVWFEICVVWSELNSKLIIIALMGLTLDVRSAFWPFAAAPSTQVSAISQA